LALQQTMGLHDPVNREEDGPAALVVGLQHARRWWSGRPQRWRRRRSSPTAPGPRQRAQQLLFWTRGDLQCLLEDLGLQGLLAEQPLQLPDLVLQGACSDAAGYEWAKLRSVSRSPYRTRGASGSAD
jgi:hypothetical protein